MFRTLLVIAIGLLPSLFSLWVIRTQWRTRTRIRQVISTFSATRRVPQHNVPLSRDRYYLEGVGYLIGDVSCEFNARSGYVRCAVNPSGPCEGCRFYEPRKTSCNENSI